MQGSSYVPQRADVSVAVIHNIPPAFILMAADSIKGDGVPNGSISTT